MATNIQATLSTAKRRTVANLRTKAHLDGWVLERQATSFANEGTWSNIDSDVTPLERRAWGSWSLLGFWCSDALNAQGWEGPSAIIAAAITGGMVNAIPLMLNGAIGAHYHIPYPIVARASFGYYLSRFAVVTRMATALFWHAIQSWTGSTAMFQIIRAIWPRFLNIPNRLPESAGITSNELIAHFVFFCVQFPILLTPPHKLKYFFAFKTLIVPVVSVATVVVMVRKAGGVDDIWNQEYTTSGSARSWIVLNNFSSQCGGWATMATNIPDFTRYMHSSRGVYWQALFLPVVYGEYIWSPLELAAQWDGPGGRCGAFFVGFCWVVAQIGTNLSASVISCSNDLISLFPKHINMRRGVILTTFTSCWIMVPWKIVYSASRNFDVPALYRRRNRYWYIGGVNWRAAAAFIISVVPNTQ
ncbi:unnamed protein product [Aureobasidium pullulans]|nr:unnamed protein product [Aureobasidium pullulans]